MISPSACIHPDDRERVGIEVRTHFANHRQNYRSEYRVVQPGGDVRVIVDEGEVLYHETGQPLRAIGTIRDVTETRRTAREIGDLRSRIWHADRAAIDQRCAIDHSQAVTTIGRPV